MKTFTVQLVEPYSAPSEDLRTTLPTAAVALYLSNLYKFTSYEADFNQFIDEGTPEVSVRVNWKVRKKTQRKVFKVQLGRTLTFRGLLDCLNIS